MSSTVHRAFPGYADFLLLWPVASKLAAGATLNKDSNSRNAPLLEFDAR